MRRQLLLVAAVFSLTLAFAGTASANDRSVCWSERTAPEAAISACTRLIRSGKLKGVELPNTYIWRGDAHAKKRDYDRAIADFSEGIRINPKDANDYIKRANIYSEKGEYDSAIVDLNEAIRLNPKSWIAYASRAHAYNLKKDFDRALADASVAIKLNPKDASGYINRAHAYSKKGDYDLAIADASAGIRLNPKEPNGYTNRAHAYNKKGDYDLAIADSNAALQLNPRDAAGYSNRASAYYQKKEYDRALADFNESIRFDPKDANDYVNRGDVYESKGERDRAIADYDTAIRLDPNDAFAYNNRGYVYNKKGEYDRAFLDLNESIRLNPKNAAAYKNRGLSHEGKGDVARALADFRTAINLGFGANKTAEREAIDGAKRVEDRLAARSSPAPESKIALLSPPPQPVSAPQGAGAPSGPRVALVIGNGNYATVPALANPANDARDMAVALRELGFEVIEGFDLDSAGMRAKIAEFGTAIAGSGTALFFYAGHGVQVAGQNYLVPVDAKLRLASSLATEAVSIDTVLADMEAEKRVNLVFLDACRDNPLTRSLAQAFGASRSASVGQGLAQVNAGIGTLITFATSPNKLALDGSGRNSPFTAALLKHIRTPDVEVRSLITRVRAEVIRQTNERQVPWDHSSLTGDFYFKRGG